MLKRVQFFEMKAQVSPVLLLEEWRQRLEAQGAFLQVLCILLLLLLLRTTISITSY